MGEALLDPVAIEAELIEQCRTGTAKIVNGERLERQALLLGPRHDRSRNAIEGRARHRRIGVVAGRKQISRVTSASLERDHDVERLLRQVDVVWPAPLHPLLRYRPDCVLEVDLVPDGLLQLALAYHGEQDEPQA